MHRLIKRQIKKYVSEADADRLKDLFAAINQSYQDFEEDNQQLERTLEKSSQELIKSNIELKQLLKSRTEEVQDVAERLKDVVNNVTEATFQTDAKGNWTFLNPAWVGITQYTIKESLGRNFSEYVHKDDKERNKTLFKPLIDGQTDFCRHVIKVVIKNGDVRWVEVFARGFRDDKDNFIGTTGTLNDITDKKKAENELKEATARYKLAVQSAKFGFWDWNLLTDHLIWDANMYEIFDVDKSIKENLFSIFQNKVHPDDSEKLFFEVNKAITRNKEVQHEFRIITNNNKIKYLKGASKVHYDESGNAVSVTGLNWDITGEKVIEKKLIQAKEDAEQASKAKAQFLSTMSHEIRTPMNAVIGISQLLLDENPREDQIQNLKALSFSSSNLLTLINDILDFSKIESGKIDLESIDFSIKDFVMGIKHSMNFAATEKGIKLKIHLDNELNFVVGDPTRVSQVLNNLISNAIKFTHKGEVSVEIIIKEKIEEEVIVGFKISDTGIGIPENKKESIFKSFSQAASNTTRKYGGTGLGLAITKKLLEIMGSKIHLESEVGKGSSFSFDLKFKQSIKTITKSKRLNDGHVASNESKDLKGKYILLVEDNPMNVLVAKQFLQKWSLTVDHAENGLSAIEKVKEHGYDLVLMDLQMPEMDGYTATNEIRKIEGLYFKKLPIIALTADAMSEIRTKVIDAGMNDYVSKPFNHEELYRKIKKYI